MQSPHTARDANLEMVTMQIAKAGAVVRRDKSTALDAKAVSKPTKLYRTPSMLKIWQKVQGSRLADQNDTKSSVEHDQSLAALGINKQLVVMQAAVR